MKKHHGVGPSTVDKIVEIYRTGGSRRAAEMLKDGELQATLALTKVWGIGEKKARELHQQLRVSSVAELRQAEAARGGVYARFGLRPATCKCIELHDELQAPIPRDEIAAIGEYVRDVASQLRPISPSVRITGSYRRGASSAHDIDLLCIVPDQPEGQGRLLDYRQQHHDEEENGGDDDERGRRGRAEAGGGGGGGGGAGGEADGGAPPAGCSVKLGVLLQLIAALKARGLITDDLTMPQEEEGVGGAFAGGFYMGLCALPGAAHSLHRRIDLRCFNQAEEAFALLHCTGSGDFNRYMSRVANGRQLTLSEKGLVPCTRHSGLVHSKQGASIPCAAAPHTAPGCCQGRPARPCTPPSLIAVRSALACACAGARPRTTSSPRSVSPTSSRPSGAARTTSSSARAAARSSRASTRGRRPACSAVPRTTTTTTTRPAWCCR